MLMAFATVLMFFLVAAGFVLVALLFGKLVRPKANLEGTAETYECGEAPVGQAWFNFNPRFYIVALIFIVFDVEIAFLYPVAVVLRRWVNAGWGVFAAAEIAVFVLILLAGLLYVWKKGDLEWLRSIKSRERSRFLEPVDARSVPKPTEPAAEDLI